MAGARAPRRRASPHLCPAPAQQPHVGPLGGNTSKTRGAPRSKALRRGRPGRKEKPQPLATATHGITLNAQSPLRPTRPRIRRSIRVTSCGLARELPLNLLNRLLFTGREELLLGLCDRGIELPQPRVTLPIGRARVAAPVVPSMGSPQPRSRSGGRPA
jgi:hypothetical protein